MRLIVCTNLEFCQCTGDPDRWAWRIRLRQFNRVGLGGHENRRLIECPGIDIPRVVVLRRVLEKLELIPASALCDRFIVRTFLSMMLVMHPVCLSTLTRIGRWPRSTRLQLALGLLPHTREYTPLVTASGLARRTDAIGLVAKSRHIYRHRILNPLSPVSCHARE